MKIWTPDEEAENLRKRFAGVNRAEFARSHHIKGGQAMIYQHLKGIRPMNMDAALAYAAGFGCELSEISPRLAHEASKVAHLASEQKTEANQATHGRWPFSVPYSAYEALDDEKKERLNERVGDFIAGAAPTKSKLKKSKAA